MKNDTPFTDETVKKYGLRICRVASQYGVMPAEVKRDPENYWIFPDGRPMSMATRRMILKRDVRRKKKENAESLEKTIKNQAVKVLNLKTEGKRLPGERPPMEVRDVEDEKSLSKETVWFMFGYAIGALMTYFVCTWRG